MTITNKDLVKSFLLLDSSTCVSGYLGLVYINDYLTLWSFTILVRGNNGSRCYNYDPKTRGLQAQLSLKQLASQKCWCSSNFKETHQLYTWRMVNTPQSKSHFGISLDSLDQMTCTNKCTTKTDGINNASRKLDSILFIGLHPLVICIILFLSTSIRKKAHA